MRKLFTILFATLFAGSCVAAPEPQQLRKWYTQINEQYFLNALPKDTVIAYGDPGETAMAVTFKDQQGRFHIVMGKEFYGAGVVAKETLLHESCHISVWNVHDSLDGHGLAWHQCMERLYREGAFEDVL
jgi:predicted SprT family Zn-dependent metalloprotease